MIYSHRPIELLWNKLLFFNFFLFLALIIKAQPDPPAGLSVEGFDSHFELKWNAGTDPSVSGYRVYKKQLPNGTQTYIGYVDDLKKSFIDFVGRLNVENEYSLTAVNLLGEESAFSDVASDQTFEMTDEELMTMVQQYTFRYFWNFAHPVSGLARERNTTSIVTTGGSGFGVMAILVGIERGFITFDEGLERLAKIVDFLKIADRFHGAWPHWMNGATGATIPFSQFDDGGDIVETAFMLQGLLTARQYFSGNSEQELELVSNITQLWEEMDWRWYRKQTQNVLYWHWSPTVGWQINFALRGFNEAQIVYLLAVASPTNFVPPSLYNNGWAGGNYTNSNTFYNYPVQLGPNSGGPLFFAHYSYLGFDPRNIKDGYANYFNRNYFHTLINREYCIENPLNHEGYSEECWGLTASDDPFGYLAHEANSSRDNGTITPTAALSSMPYTPPQSIQALKHFYRDHGDRLWGEFGFYDAFNLDQDWFATSYLAIDQGPIICMIENYRTGLLWENFMANPEISPALELVGFVPDTTLVSTNNVEASNLNLTVSPNPLAIDSEGLINIKLKQQALLDINIYSISGRKIKTVCTDNSFQKGAHQIAFNTDRLTPATYFMVIQSQGWTSALPFVVE